jgi:hypothetical protein
VPATDPKTPPAPYVVTGVTMRALLASCAAAEAVSRPPLSPPPKPAPRTEAA